MKSIVQDVAVLAVLTLAWRVTTRYMLDMREHRRRERLRDLRRSELDARRGREIRCDEA
jgi:hypothetical protein